METKTPDTTIRDGWARAPSTTPGIVLVGTLGALAGFVFARFLWM